MDTVSRGHPSCADHVERSPSQLTSSTFYYTTDPVSRPQQNVAIRYYAPVPPTPGRYSAYLPMVLASYAPCGDQPGPNAMTFYWDTADVTPGTYYLCTSLADPYNQATYCSEAPVEVSLP